MVAALAMTACSESDDTVEAKDWSTDTYFASSDAQSMATYYKPSVGYVGDPMPFYDPKAGNFKILYLQDFRPNQAGTYHPIWGVETTDGSSYTSLGELISCGGLKEQDAALGTGSTVYNDADGLYYTFYTGNKYQPTADECAEAVMMATSPDFKTWSKSRTFLLRGSDYGYSRSDFRDPFVRPAQLGQQRPFHEHDVGPILRMSRRVQNGRLVVSGVQRDARCRAPCAVFQGKDA